MVAASNKESAADDIAKRDWYKIAEHVAPAIITRGEEAGGQVIHVGDGMLKATDDKGGDWEDNSEHFTRDSFSGGGEPDSKTDQQITKNTKNESLAKAEIDFSVGDIGGGGTK